MTSSSSLTSVSRSETPNPRYELDSVGWHSRQGGDIRERHRAISKPRDENRRTAGSPDPAREHRQRGIFLYTVRVPRSEAPNFIMDGRK